ncbi:putative RNA-directed DNA polymerase, partial [Aphis craccivora]
MFERISFRKIYLKKYSQINVDGGLEGLRPLTFATKLNEIKKSILPWPPPPGCSRRQETILNHLRIRHTLLIHRYFMTREDPPIAQLTILHIFTECRNNQQELMETFGATQLYKIFSPEPTEIQKLFIFLKNLLYLKKYNLTKGFSRDNDPTLYFTKGLPYIARSTL